MKIAFSAMLNPTQGLSLSRQGGAKAGAVPGIAAQAARGDRMTLSKAGRKAAESSSDGFLKNLIDRKSYLQDRRKEFLTTAAKDPTQKKWIKFKIEEIDKQLGEINQQMSDYLLQKQQEALESQKKKNGEKEEELSPQELRDKQMQNVAEARENLSRSSELGVTRAVLKRSKAHAEEWMGSTHSLSPLGNEASRLSYASTVDKLDKGIQELEHAQRDLNAKAQKLAEEAASLPAQTAAPAEETGKEEEKGMLSSLEKELEDRREETKEAKEPA